MSMLTTHFSNLCMTPAIVKKLLGFKVNPSTALANANGNSATGSSNSFSPPLPPVSSSASSFDSSNMNHSPETTITSTTHLIPSTNINSSNNNVTSINNSLINHNKLCEKAIRALVKKLKKTPGALEELERAITTKDQSTKCILIPTKTNNLAQDKMQISNRKTLPHVVYCRIWRWADLQNCNELKSVGHCQQGYNHQLNNLSSSNNKIKLDDQSLVCINPYHYVRIESQNSHSHNLTNSTNPNLLTVYVPKLSNNNNETLINNNQQQQLKMSAQQQHQQQQLQHSNNLAKLNHQLINPLPPPPPPPLQQPSTSSSTSSSSSSIVKNDSQQQHQLSVTGDLIHSSTYMITASPSPISVLSPSSIASNAISQQFSPFISEDDSSEINDISPSPLDLMPVQMVEQPYWCSLSYYEMKQRVGEMFHVASDVHSVTIDGYTDPSSAQRFCLGVLSNVNRTQDIELTRHYIGRGLMLSHENGQVFAECLSDNPVFVQSPNCNQRYNWHLATVVKIPPGCSLKIFDVEDFIKLANETVYQGFEAVYALTRICTIRISFVKGWGAEYRRQTILNTPCWIEVHLNNPLKLVDQILTKMGSPRTKCTSFS